MMQNALQSPQGGAPPAPNPTPGDQGASMPMQNAIAAGPQGAPANAPAPPTHQQTVVALRHFHAIEEELSGLLADPDCGKADLRSKIIDGATSLVSQGIMSAAQAVTELGNVPDKPYDQKAWLEQHLMQTTQAQSLVLAHHQQGFLGQNVDTTPPPPDDHQATMSGLLKNYQGAKNG